MEERCPEDASLYNPCVCTKLYSEVTSAISSDVKASCSNSEDVTAAQQFFDEYCDLGRGTSSFAAQKGPPGDSKT